MINLNSFEEADGEIKSWTYFSSINQFQFCNLQREYNIDLLTALESKKDTTISINISSNIFTLEPINEYSTFTQDLFSGVRTVPACGPILFSNISYTSVVIKCDEELTGYGVLFDDEIEREKLRKKTVLYPVTSEIVLEYKEGFLNVNFEENHVYKLQSFGIY